jgi:hypothetical protein
MRQHYGRPETPYASFASTPESARDTFDPGMAEPKLDGPEVAAALLDRGSLLAIFNDYWLGLMRWLRLLCDAAHGTCTIR